MKKLFLLASLLATSMSFAADVKISSLPLGSAATAGINDSFPYVQASTNITKRLTLWDLINLPPVVSTYAPKANPTFTGTVTAPTFVGALTGNASTATALAANPTDCASNTFANAIVASGNLTCAAVGDAALSTSYLKADGTRALTGNWAAGAFSATHNSVAVGSSAGVISGLTSLVNGSGSVVMNSTGAMTVPGATDTFVGKATTDTLTNKTIGSGGGNAVAAGAITSGTLATARGGTNLDSSASTGVAKVSGGTWSVASLVNADISSSAAIATSKIALTSPTVQVFTSGSGTYTTAAGVKYIRVLMVGGGGGGAGSGAVGTPGAATAGGNSTFGTTLLVANGGGAGSQGGVGGAGGTASLGTGPIGMAIAGGMGGGGGYTSTSTAIIPGGMGGANPLGGSGGGGYVNGTGGAAIANTGGGGGGAQCKDLSSNYCGSGGGAGGYVNAIITSPSATYSYAVGAKGNAGTAGTNGFAAGDGGSGYIIVYEFYQ